MTSPTGGGTPLQPDETPDEPAADAAGASTGTGVDTTTPAGTAVAAATGGSIAQAGLWGDVWRQLRRKPQFILGASVVAVLMVMAAFPRLFTSTDPRACDLSRSRQKPSADAWFGYDVQGCDYYANVIYGARVSVAIGLLVVGGSLLIGLTLGALAGFFGSWIDSLVARTADIIYGLPLILGAIIILYRFQERNVLIVSFALIVLSWMTPMRLVR